ncbi:hypothetical protein JB92DRAFT_2916950 [Gautieria morchelliformis]|nr:hypothetical protein JB92DRAFT_2916950 [Gautieria morchelliformis]
MRTPRLPPLDTTGYISCPIDTPLFDFDNKSPLPCIIVTPSSPTEYHIAFHHKSSPLKGASFSAQQLEQQQQQPRARRVLLTALNPFVDTPPPSAQSFEMTPRRLPLKPRTRTALVLAVPIFIIVCHILASSLLRTAGLGNTIFGGSLSRGGFSSAAAHMRAQRDAPLPVPVPAPVQHRPLGKAVDPLPISGHDLD